MQRNPERIRDPQQTPQARIAPRALDIRNIAPGKLAQIRERLLRPTLAFPRAQDTLGQSASNFYFGLGFHGGYQIRLNERVSLMRDRWPGDRDQKPLDSLWLQ